MPTHINKLLVEPIIEMQCNEMCVLNVYLSDFTIDSQIPFDSLSFHTGTKTHTHGHRCPSVSQVTVVVEQRGEGSVLPLDRGSLRNVGIESGLAAWDAALAGLSR